MPEEGRSTAKHAQTFGEFQTGWAPLWTDPLSPRPPRWVFLLVRPHKVSNKVSNVLFELCERTEREREAHRSTLLSFGGGVINAVKMRLSL